LVAASYKKHSSLRGAEGDAAIQCGALQNTGLLRFARNDEPIANGGNYGGA